MTDQLAVDYEGTEPFPDGDSPPRTVEGAVRVAVTAAIVIVPFAGLGVAVWFAWGRGLHFTDILLAAAFYLVTGHHLIVLAESCGIGKLTTDFASGFSRQLAARRRKLRRAFRRSQPPAFLLNLAGM